MSTPSARDRRRLQDGERALAISTDRLHSLSDGELKDLSMKLWDATAAMQSLDDLGSEEANSRAWADMQKILRKAKKVDAELERRKKDG